MKVRAAVVLVQPTLKEATAGAGVGDRGGNQLADRDHAGTGLAAAGPGGIRGDRAVSIADLAVTVRGTYLGSGTQQQWDRSAAYFGSASTLQPTGCCIATGTRQTRGAAQERPDQRRLRQGKAARELTLHNFSPGDSYPETARQSGRIPLPASRHSWLPPWHPNPALGKALSLL